MDKPMRLLIAMRDESLKRVPYIIAVLLFLLLVSSYINSQRTAANTQATKKLTNKVLELSNDNKTLIQQNKDLTTQNNDLAQKNATQLQCISNIFVDFINQDGRPSHADIENCQSVLNRGGNEGPTLQKSRAAASNPQPSDGKPSAAHSTAKKPASSGGSGDTTTPPPQTSQPGLLKRTVCTLTLSLLGCQ